VAIALLTISNPCVVDGLLFSSVAEVAAWTLAEYITIALCCMASRPPVQHGNIQSRTAYNMGIDKIFWQIWVALSPPPYLAAGTAVLAGVLVAYAWYLLSIIAPITILQSSRLAC